MGSRKIRNCSELPKFGTAAGAGAGTEAALGPETRTVAAVPVAGKLDSHTVAAATGTVMIATGIITVKEAVRWPTKRREARLEERQAARLEESTSAVLVEGLGIRRLLEVLILDDKQKLAHAAAVRAQKSKKKTWWSLSRNQMIASAAVVLLAIGYHVYKNRTSLFGNERKNQANEALRIGNIHLEQGDFTTAIYYYELATKLYPSLTNAWTNLGTALTSQMRRMLDKEPIYKRAVEAYQKALAVSPSDVEAAFNLGVLHQSMDKVDLAIPWYQRALSHDPKHFDALGNLGSALHKKSDLDGAIKAYTEAIEILKKADQTLVDHHQVSMLYYLLGAAFSSKPVESCSEMSCLDRAVEKLKLSLQHNPGNEEAKHALSALIADPNVTAASNTYISTLFDEYAATFDKSLVQDLNYTVPKQMSDVIATVMTQKRVKSFNKVVDVGCGTGLLGPYLRNVSTTLVGIDLSVEMLEYAQQRNVYDMLYIGEVSTTLQLWQNKSDTENFRQLDLITAADVFVYAGDLQPYFQSAAASLKKNGWFVLSLERLEKNESATEDANAAGSAAEAAGKGKGMTKYSVSDEDLKRGWKLQLSGRFAHTRAYVVELAKQHHFQVLHHENIIPRKDNMVDVQGQLLVLQGCCCLAKFLLTPRQLLNEERGPQMSRSDFLQIAEQLSFLRVTRIKLR
eukprot:757942-Hanusia_phi.AAC.2